MLRYVILTITFSKFSLLVEGRERSISTLLSYSARFHQWSIAPSTFSLLSMTCTGGHSANNVALLLKCLLKLLKEIAETVSSNYEKNSLYMEYRSRYSSVTCKRVAVEMNRHYGNALAIGLTRRNCSPITTHLL